MIFAGNCMRNCWTATSYAKYHRNGCTHAAYSPGCRPLGSHSRLATTPSTMPRRLHRYKTLPACAPAAHPVQNSPGTRPPRAIPVQNSPSTPEIPLFGAFCASRENFVPLPPPPSRAGRIFYRIRNHLRYKTLPARPKHPFSAHFAPAGRTLYRFHHHQAEQGEKSHARAAPRGAGQALTTPGTP